MGGGQQESRKVYRSFLRCFNWPVDFPRSIVPFLPRVEKVGEGAGGSIPGREGETLISARRNAKEAALRLAVMLLDRVAR